jgi:uncharacterized protein
MFKQGTPAVGIAHSDSIDRVLAEHPGLIDYVEIPFEQLLHAPSAIAVKAQVPVILHCASLSIAGDVQPDPQLVEQLVDWIRVTETPWLGEHLAYVRADGHLREIAEHRAVAGPCLPGTNKLTDLDPSLFMLDGKPYNVGYTVSPQFSQPILNRVVSKSAAWEEKLGVPVLLENGPIYFTMPGSTLSQVEFINALCAAKSSAKLLLDLSHLAITCFNLDLDPIQTLNAIPLERVVEVHLSGMRVEGGVAWDDHVLPASKLIFDLLTRLMARAMPQAVTLEYNWDANFPIERLAADVSRVRTILMEA